MKTILLGTDVSANLSPAWERAIKLARENRADLHIVHVVDENLPESVASSEKNQAIENINSRIKQLDLESTLSVKTQVIVGKESEEFVVYSKEVRADLIVIGVRKALYEGFFRGTTSEEIIRFSEAPVLVVKDPVSASYSRIAVCMDFSVHSRLAFEFSLKIAPDAQFYLIHAYQDPIGDMLFQSESRLKKRESELQRLESLILSEMENSTLNIDTDNRAIERIIKRGEVRQVIRHEVKQLEPDLLVLGTHGRTGIGYALLGSVAQDILGNPPCDTMAVKAW